MADDSGKSLVRLMKSLRVCFWGCLLGLVFVYIALMYYTSTPAGNSAKANQLKSLKVTSQSSNFSDSSNLVAFEQNDANRNTVMAVSNNIYSISKKNGRGGNIGELQGHVKYKNVIDLKVIKRLRMLNIYRWNDTDPDAWKYLPMKVAGNDSEEHQERVIYNRVHKCGSRTVTEILRELAIENKFNFVTSQEYFALQIDQQWQKRMVHTLDKVQTPFIFERHLHYVDFTRYGSKQPAYINVIREPLTRVVSLYYFMRFGDYSIRSHFYGSEKEKYQTFDDCVLQGKHACKGQAVFQIIPYFCGQDERCTSPSSWALQTAISNVENNFLFVGILEEMEDTLAILEKLLPSIFRKAVYVYKNHATIQYKIRTMSTRNKTKPSPEVERIMKTEMDYEYQFYNYIKQKFYKIRDNLGIKSSM